MARVQQGAQVNLLQALMETQVAVVLVAALAVAVGLLTLLTKVVQAAVLHLESL